MPSPTPFRRGRNPASYRNGAKFPNARVREKWKRDRFARTVAPVLDALRDAGVVGNREIADALTAHGLPSESGGRWTLHAVGALKLRLRMLAERSEEYAGKA